MKAQDAEECEAVRPDIRRDPSCPLWLALVVLRVSVSPW